MRSYLQTYKMHAGAQIASKFLGRQCNKTYIEAFFNLFYL